MDRRRLSRLQHERYQRRQLRSCGNSRAGEALGRQILSQKPRGQRHSHRGRIAADGKGGIELIPSTPLDILPNYLIISCSHPLPHKESIMAKKREVNKAQAVRDFMAAANPEANPKEVSETLTKKGIEVSYNYVYTVKGKMAGKKGKKTPSASSGSRLRKDRHRRPRNQGGIHVVETLRRSCPSPRGIGSSSRDSEGHVTFPARLVSRELAGRCCFLACRQNLRSGVSAYFRRSAKFCIAASRHSDSASGDLANHCSSPVVTAV